MRQRTIAETAMVGPGMGAALSDGVPRVNAGASALTKAAESGFAPLPGLATTTGREGGTAFGGGIGAMENTVAGAGHDLQVAANDQFQQLKALADVSGNMGAIAYAQGMRKQIGSVSGAAEALKSAANVVLSATAWASSSGVATMQAYAAGLRQGSVTAINVARATAASVRSILIAKSPPQHPLLRDIGKWGLATILEYAKGLERGIPAIANVLGQIPDLFRGNAMAPAFAMGRGGVSAAPATSGGGFGGQVNLTININGATDPRAVGEEVGRIIDEKLGDLMGDANTRYLPGATG
jgi:hypothetical protein